VVVHGDVDAGAVVTAKLVCVEDVGLTIAVDLLFESGDAEIGIH
jgi:hypothetical protein